MRFDSPVYKLTPSPNFFLLILWLTRSRSCHRLWTCYLAGPTQVTPGSFCFDFCFWVSGFIGHKQFTTEWRNMVCTVPTCITCLFASSYVSWWLYPTYQPLKFPLPSTAWEIDVPRATQARNFRNCYNIWRRHGSPAHHALHQPGQSLREQWEQMMLRVGITISTRTHQGTKWISTS